MEEKQFNVLRAIEYYRENKGFRICLGYQSDNALILPPTDCPPIEEYNHALEYLNMCLEINRNVSGGKYQSGQIIDCIGNRIGNIVVYLNN